MSGVLRFFIHVPPGVKGNSKRIVRFGRRLGLIGRDKDRQCEADVVRVARQFAPPEPWLGPLRLDVTFVLAPPASWSDKKKDAAVAGEILPDVRPDRGNYLKLIEDALPHAGFCRDDAQFCVGEVAKRYGAVAGYEIAISRIGGVAT